MPMDFCLGLGALETPICEPWVVTWKMGSDRKMCGLSPNGLCSTSMIMGGRVFLSVVKRFLGPKNVD